MRTTVRDATDADLPVIVELLNVAVHDGTALYRDEPYTTVDRREWLAARRERGFPVMVADDGGGAIGFGTYGDFRDSIALPGYRFTVEHSVHVARTHWHRGVGRMLLEGLIAHAGAAGVHVMVAGIDAENEASIRFHQRLGFVETARMPEVGFKFGRWLDLVLMQLQIDPVPATPDA